MSDVLRGKAPKIAIGAAIAALLTSAAAVIVVTARGGKSSARAGSGVASAAERQVAAADVTKLRRDAVEKVAASGKVIGVKVVDGDVRATLGLEPEDVITAIGGRAIKREFDVYDAVLGMSMMDASIVYVELVRDGKPALLRWRLDGDLRAARRAEAGGQPSSMVSLTGSADPLIDTIRRIDDFHVEVPRSTIDRLLASAPTYARGARIVPSFRSGRSDGIKLFAIRPSSVFAAAGFVNGDTIRTVNGHELGTADDGFEIYEQIKSDTEWRFEITRRGKAEVLTIMIK